MMMIIRGDLKRRQSSRQPLVFIVIPLVDRLIDRSLMISMLVIGIYLAKVGVLLSGTPKGCSIYLIEAL